MSLNGPIIFLAAFIGILVYCLIPAILSLLTYLFLKRYKNKELALRIAGGVFIILFVLEFYLKEVL
jgi:hypothetical protein